MGSKSLKGQGVCHAYHISLHALGGVLGALGDHFAPFFRIRFQHRFFIDFFRFRKGFGRVLGGQNGQKIEILEVFLDVLVETLFLVDFSRFLIKSMAKNMLFFCYFVCYFVCFSQRSKP